jgi:3-oxoacyl-[acyl-carrier-protein] synthase II
MGKGMPERVVITGMGLVCPLGNDVETVWRRMLNGENGFGRTTVFNASTFPTTFSAQVKDFELSLYIKNIQFHKHCNRACGFALGAVVQAARQGQIDIETDAPSDGIERTRLGIYLGAGEGSIDNNAFFTALVKGWDGSRGSINWPVWTPTMLGRMDAMRELEQEANMPAAHIALLTAARGPVINCLTACAASTQAVGEATQIIRRGDADVMITGGAHSMIHPLGITGFNRLTALSTRNDNPQTASRPFTASRDGFVIGEGAAIVILESLSSAVRRGANILAEVLGYGSSSDAFRITDMHEDGRGPIQAIKAALADAGIDYTDIDYINTHGTGTVENDMIETVAIKEVFKERAKQIPASSTKSMMGHLIGAAGAAELIACVLAIRDNIVPPTINLNDPDPKLDLDYVPNKPRKAAVNTALNESFGFGGQNNVVIVRRYRPD